MQNRRPKAKQDLTRIAAADAPIPKGMVRVATAMAVPALLTEHGLDPAPLLAEFGLDLADYEEPENRIPYATLGRLLGRCAERTRCPHFGMLVGQRAGISALGEVGFLMQSSPDVRTALELAVRHLWAHNPSAMVELVEEDSFASLRYVILRFGLDQRDQLLDMAVAIEINVMRALCGHHWQPLEVRFAHARSRNLAPFRQFFQAPLVFDANETAVVFATEWLDKPLPGADPLLHIMMQHRVSELHLQSGEDLTVQLRRMLPSLVTARHALITVAAKRVGLSVRTMSRRLTAEGTSFTRLREEARYAIARQLLQGTSMPANQITEHLGYANPSAFTRAFRQWSGVAPVEWRASKKRRFLKRSSRVVAKRPKKGEKVP
jgi:AraC-like DNA-binding protein